MTPNLKRLLSLIGFTVAANLSGQIPSKDYQPPNDIEFRTTEIISDGTRLHAEVYTAADTPAAQQLPTIILCHGWAGLAAHLRREGVAFARAGFLVVAFDYKGWGESDGKVVLQSPRPDKSDNGQFKADVREIREVVDPLDQASDISNVIHWVQGESNCDKERIGLWGSSSGGGLVVTVAAREPRIKALVSQVPSLDGRWSITIDDARVATYQQATDRARGDLGYPDPGVTTIGELKGAPIMDKFSQWAPVEDVHRAASCAMLFILAENEELFDNEEHGVLAHQRAKGPKKIVTIPEIKHYGIYYEAHEQAKNLALDWFEQHL